MQRRGPEIDSEAIRRVVRSLYAAAGLRRLEEERREEERSPWIRRGDRNIIKQDRLPPAAKPYPSHPGDEDRFKIK